MSTDSSYFIRTWKIRDARGHARIANAFPSGKPLKIEESPKGVFHVTWTDAEGVTHELHGLRFEGGRLVGERVRDEGTGLDWIVTVEDDGSGGITGNVKLLSLRRDEIDEDGESNLAGTWGADAPPPILPEGSSSGS